MGRYPFLKDEDFKTIEERIDIAKNNILSSDIPWNNKINQSGQNLKDLFWQIFCANHLMEEILIGQPAYWIMRLNTVIKKVVNRYNAMWEATSRNYDFLIEYEKLRGEKAVYNENNINTGHMESSGNNTSKSIFNDTPSTKLNDMDYATNITEDSSDSSNTSDANNTAKKDSLNNIDGWEKGRNKSIPELTTEYIDSLRDIAGEMEEEVSKKMFYGIIGLEVY